MRTLLRLLVWAAAKAEFCPIAVTTKDLKSIGTMVPPQPEGKIKGGAGIFAALLRSISIDVVDLKERAFFFSAARAFAPVGSNYFVPQGLSLPLSASFADRQPRVVETLKGIKRENVTTNKTLALPGRQRQLSVAPARSDFVAAAIYLPLVRRLAFKAPGFRETKFTERSETVASSAPVKTRLWWRGSCETASHVNNVSTLNTEVQRL